MDERVACPYCGEGAALVPGDIIYPHRPDLRHKQFWRCADCDAHVGTHKGTTKPLGTLATATTRKARLRAHQAFDTLWRKKGMSRPAAYLWLAKQLDMTAGACHIGQFTEAQCAKVVSAAATYNQKGKSHA